MYNHKARLAGRIVDILGQVRGYLRSIIVGLRNAGFKGARNNGFLTNEDLLLMLFLIPVTLLAIIGGTLLFAYNYPDSEKYLLLVRFFRGDAVKTELLAPWCYRPGLPLLVAVLPFDPTLGFKTLNAMFLLVVAWCFYLLCREFHRSPFSCFLLSFACTFSHPAMGYGAVVLVETPAIAFTALAALLTVKSESSGRWKTTLMVISVGTAFKETVIFASFAYLLVTRRKDLILPFLALPASVYAACRFLLDPNQAGVGFLWPIHFRNLIEHPNTTLYMLGASILIFVPFVIIALIGGTNPAERKSSLRWLRTTFFALLGIPLMGLFMGAFTSRFIWPLYISLAPMTAMGIERAVHLIERIVLGALATAEQAIAVIENRVAAWYSRA